MATVYVKPTSNYLSRSQWNSTNGYSISERVEYDDGNTVKIYVCINSVSPDVNGANPTPDASSDWALAGSKEYPFLNLNGELYNTDMSTIEYNWFQGQTSFAIDAAGPDGTIILLRDDSDPEYNVQNIGGNPGPSTTYNQRIIADKLNTKITLNRPFSQSSTHGSSGSTTYEGFWFYATQNSLLDSTASNNGNVFNFVNCKIDFQSYGGLSNQYLWGYSTVDITFDRCLILCPDGFRSLFYSSGTNANLYPSIKTSTVIYDTLNATHNDNCIGKGICDNTIFYVKDRNGVTNTPNQGTSVITNCCFFESSGTLSISSSEGINTDPLFIDPASGDYRLRPGSPVIGGISSSKFPSDSIWIKEGSGIGTGTESDPYYFDQFTNALAAAASSNSKKVVLKDGTYVFSLSNLEDSNINYVTFTSENLHGATISDGSQLKIISTGVDNTLNLNGVSVYSGAGFIDFQSVGNVRLIADNCAISFGGGYLNFYEHIIRKSTIKSNGRSIDGFNVSLDSCTIIENSSTSNHTLLTLSQNPAIKLLAENCIFWNDPSNPSSVSPFLNGSTTNCISFNYGAQTGCTQGDPLLVDPNNGNYQLRPSSIAIGGAKPEESNVYYLQPGNTYNGDGSQKDASAMTADGDPGPFNEFNKILAAGVPYGSTVVIVDGTYNWPDEFNTTKNSTNWATYTYEGYNYVAETNSGVIFDANKQQKYFGYMPYGVGGQFLELDTTFSGVQFNNVVGTGSSSSRNQIFTASSSAGYGSCTFKKCRFLNWINTGGSTHPWTGGTRDGFGSSMHWEGCLITIAFDYDNSLLGGGDAFADDAYHGAWSWENCTFYIPSGMTTFNGRNAANGTYVPLSRIFGVSYNQSSRIFKNNILFNGSGSATLGPSSSNFLPSIEGNCFLGVSIESAYQEIINESQNLIDIDPLFVDPSSNSFGLRPLSPLIGIGK